MFLHGGWLHLLGNMLYLFILGLWALIQVASALVSDSNVLIAWYAHIGGFAAGLLAGPLLRRRRTRRRS
jgi:membrane associated rhomboid family serine protease